MGYCMSRWVSTTWATEAMMGEASARAEAEASTVPSTGASNGASTGTSTGASTVPMASWCMERSTNGTIHIAPPAIAISPVDISTRIKSRGVRFLCMFFS